MHSRGASSSILIAVLGILSEESTRETTRRFSWGSAESSSTRQQVGCAQWDGALIMLTLVRSSEELMLNRRTFIAAVSLSPLVAQAPKTNLQWELAQPRGGDRPLRDFQRQRHSRC